MTTISNLIVADSIDKRTVSILPYIPGEQIMIHTSIVGGDGVIYTVPNDYILLLAFLGIGQTSSAGYKEIVIDNGLGIILLQPLCSTQASAGYNLTSRCSFNPLLQLEPGMVVKGYSGTAGVATEFSLVGYLVPTWNGA